MTHIEVILRIPLPAKRGDEYLQGFVDATLAPVHAAIEEGLLNIDAMLDRRLGARDPRSRPTAMVRVNAAVDVIAITEDSLGG